MPSPRAVMDVRELKVRLDELAWHEQVNGELRERPGTRDPGPPSVGDELRSLAGAVDRRLLDELEAQPGCAAWMLRLAALVEPASARARALRYLDSADWEVQHWAKEIVDGPA